MKMDTFPDCFMTVYDKFNNEMKLVRFLYGIDAQSGRESNGIQN